MNHILVYQELEEDGQVARSERHQEGAQAAVDDLHAGPAPGATLAGLLQGPDGMKRTANHHECRPQEAKHLQADDHLGTPALIRKFMKAVEFPLLLSPEAEGDWKDCQKSH